MKINCLIIDDEPLAREGLSEYVKQIDYLNLVGTCENAVMALNFLRENKVDLLFLDIQMPMLTGLDFLKNLSNPPKVIFTTAYSEYALDGYELNVVDYLLKPIPFERFLKAVEKTYQLLSSTLQEKSEQSGNTETTDSFFFIKTDKKYVKVSYDSILYIEGEKDYVKIYTEKERHMVLINIKNIQLRLPESKFMRVHKSYIVSLEKILFIDGNMIKINNLDIPIGKEYREQVDDFIREKLIKRNL